MVVRIAHFEHAVLRAVRANVVNADTIETVVAVFISVRVLGIASLEA